VGQPVPAAVMPVEALVEPEAVVAAGTAAVDGAPQVRLDTVQLPHGVPDRFGYGLVGEQAREVLAQPAVVAGVVQRGEQILMPYEQCGQLVQRLPVAIGPWGGARRRDLGPDHRGA